MKFLSILLLLFSAFSVGHSLQCFSCNTDKLFCPPKIVTCPHAENQEFNKCLSFTKNEHKYKGCYMELRKMIKKAVNPPFLGLPIFLDTIKKIYPYSTRSECDTDLCNGSEKYSKKSQIVFIVAGVLLVLFQLF